MTTCSACGQPMPTSARPCATCGHPMSFHALTETPPRIHKACVLQEGRMRCDCRQFVAVRHDP